MRHGSSVVVACLYIHIYICTVRLLKLICDSRSTNIPEPLFRQDWSPRISRWSECFTLKNVFSSKEDKQEALEFLSELYPVMNNQRGTDMKHKSVFRYLILHSWLGNRVLEGLSWTKTNQIADLRLNNCVNSFTLENQGYFVLKFSNFSSTSPV